MNTELQVSQIETKILVIRGQQVMIDRDLAELYGVETRVINQAVSKNRERFPEKFCFQLSDEEFERRYKIKRNKLLFNKRQHQESDI